eukprot:357381-Chlamydomonas_euryale.AAC.14
MAMPLHYCVGRMARQIEAVVLRPTWAGMMRDIVALSMLQWFTALLQAAGDEPTGAKQPTQDVPLRTSALKIHRTASKGQHKLPAPFEEGRTVLCTNACTNVAQLESAAARIRPQGLNPKTCGTRWAQSAGCDALRPQLRLRVCTLCGTALPKVEGSVKRSYALRRTGLYVWRDVQPVQRPVTCLRPKCMQSINSTQAYHLWVRSLLLWL